MKPFVAYFSVRLHSEAIPDFAVPKWTQNHKLFLGSIRLSTKTIKEIFGDPLCL